MDGEAVRLDVRVGVRLNAEEWQNKSVQSYVLNSSTKLTKSIQFSTRIKVKIQSVQGEVKVGRVANDSKVSQQSRYFHIFPRSFCYSLTFLFFSGTVRRASARPYYGKTQRMPHAQSDRDVSYLAMLTAMVEGRILYTGCGFLSHRMFNETQG